MSGRARSAVGWGAAAMLLASCSVDQQVSADRSRAVTTSTQAAEVPDGMPPSGGSPPPTTEPVVPPTTTHRPPPSSPPSSLPSSGAPDVLVPVGDGAGDALYPDLGNPGIDVVDYAVELTYDSVADSLEGSVTLTIQPTESRREFTLDSAGPVVSQVTIDGAEVSFENDDPELRITPDDPLVRGRQIVVQVDYTATPDALTTGGLPAGWFNTEDGSYVLNEPDGARSWLPSNDHPSDKATWTFSITVATGVTAVANGVLVSSADGPDGTTWVWRADDPMPTYLILLITGDYELVDGTGPGGLPLLSAVLRDDKARVQPYLDSIGAQIDFYDDFFGPYPLHSYGVAITDSFGGLAMETLGRSLFSRDDLQGDVGYVQELLLSHELAHQWFGDAVSPLVWQDIWLNESFATYAQWMWLEHQGLAPIETQAADALAGRQQDTGSPTGSPTADELFGFNSYDGGAVVLHALRQTVGDEKFFVTLQRWAGENYGTSRSTGDFIALAEEVAGTDLGTFFDDWLFAKRPPAEYPPPAQ